MFSIITSSWLELWSVFRKVLASAVHVCVPEVRNGN